MITDMIARGWNDFIARSEGPLSFRFVLQPTLAVIVAFIAGLKDARAGRPAFLWAALTSRQHRGELLRNGWKDVRMPLVIGLTMDLSYQLIIFKFLYPLELIFTALVLAVLPYLVLRGPFNRLGRLLMRRKGAAAASGEAHESRSG